MTRRPIRVATTEQLAASVRAAGLEAYVLPEEISRDINRSLDARLREGAICRAFLENHDIELVLDYNAQLLTLVPGEGLPGSVALTAATVGIPHVACYLDPVTSTMSEVAWADHWQLLEHPSWIKWVWETAHGEELMRMGIPNVLVMPMAADDAEYDRSPLPEPRSDGVLVVFLGHPASSWFRSPIAVPPERLYAGMIGAAVHADLPDLPFHKIYFDLYSLGSQPRRGAAGAERAAASQRYFSDKFAYNAYLAIRQRDRWARFLKTKLGDVFELVGDFWSSNYGLPHTPRIWDKRALRDRMRRTPICLNLMKGCLESGLNLRHFEITANGGFMLTYPTPELPERFAVGRECEVFINEQDLLEKIAHYTAHPRERCDVAAAGQRRTLSEHLYSHRILRLVDILEHQGVLPRRRPTEAACSVEPARGLGEAPTPSPVAGGSSPSSLTHLVAAKPLKTGAEAGTQGGPREVGVAPHAPETAPVVAPAAKPSGPFEHSWTH
jgi:hypothetical protein